MGKFLTIKVHSFSMDWEILPASKPKAQPPILGGINGFLTIHAAGNNSGALLLTIFALTDRRSDEEFTLKRAASAVQEGDGQIGEACRKQKLRRNRFRFCARCA